MRRVQSCILPLLTIFLAGGVQTALASVIDFETLTGPNNFAAAGNAQTLNISTGIGTVTVSGGVVLTATTGLPVDQTSIYGTAGNATSIGVPTPGTGYSNVITVTFPQAIANFFLDVINGNTIPVTFQVADNNGHSQTFTVAPNVSSGKQTIGFAAAGTVITVIATTGQSISVSSAPTKAMLLGAGFGAGATARRNDFSAKLLPPHASATANFTWDFFIDNIHFNEALPQSLGGPAPSVPVPPSVLLLLTGLLGAGLFLLRRKLSQRS